MKDSKDIRVDLNEARERNIIRVEQGKTVNVVPRAIFLGDDYTKQQTKYAEKFTPQAVPTRTVAETVTDTLHSLDEGVNSGVNNALDAVIYGGRNLLNSAEVLVRTPANVIGSVIEGESPVKAVIDTASKDYLPGSAEIQEAVRDAINLVPTDEYEEQKYPYYSDKFKYQKKKLDEATASDSELENLVNTLRYYRDNPSYSAMGAAREVGDMVASAAMGGAAARVAGISSKVGGSLVGEVLGSFGGAVSELNNRGVEIDSAKALATASSIAAVNVATQRAFNTKYSPEEVIDNLLKVSANSQGKFIQPSKYAGKTVTSIMAEGTEEGVQSAYETGAINLASGKNITSGMGRNVGEGVALGGTLGGASSLLGSPAKDGNTTKNKQPDPNILNPNHKNYDPANALSNVLANTQSPDANVRQQAKAEVSKIFDDAHTNFNSLVSEMNNETDETKKAELKDKVTNHYNTYIRPLQATHEAYKNVADTGLNPAEIFSKNQELNAKRLADIQTLSQEYSPYLSNTTEPNRTNTNSSQPVRVAIMGDRSKKDTGTSTNDHYDLRLAKVNGKRGDISLYLDRFMVNGKPLNSHTQTGNYMEQRKGYKHEGVDYGFDTSFGKDANARNLYVNPEYQVTDIRAFDNNKHGGGWVTQVTFSDGIKVNILHQNREGAQSVASEFKTGASTSATGTQTSTSNVNTSWSGKKHRDLQFSNQYDDLLKEVYSKYGFTAEEQNILKAQIAQESNFNINIKSPAQAFGLTQFIPSTAAKYGVREGDARSQIEGQAKFMGDLLNQFNGDWAKALAAYNTGAANVTKHWGNDGTGKGGGVMTTRWSGGTGETLKYVENILAHANVSSVTGTSRSYQFDGSNSEIDQLNNLLNQWEQEEANATNEAERAKLQEQIGTLKAKLDGITNTEQEQKATEEGARQAFAVEFNPNLSQEEIDNNPFLSDKEKEEYKQSLEVIQEVEGVQPNNTQSKSPEAVRRNYDDIEQELQLKQAPQTEQRTQSSDTGLIDNEPIFIKRFSLSTTTPEEIDNNPKLSDNQKRAIHKMMGVQRQVADTRDVEGVTNDIIVGSTGNTLRESNRGLQDYISGFENAINNNNIKLADELFTDLEYLRDTRVSKNNAINQALQLVQDNGITDINNAPIIAQDADTKEWFVTEYTGLRETYPEFNGSNALTVFKPNKLTEQIGKEAELVDDFTNAWLDYLSDYNAEGSTAPVLDTSMATVSSKSNNRVTRSYDEAEANFDSKEFTQERAKSELPPLVETNKNPINVKAGKIQLVQDSNQVPEEGTFLGRGTYKDESGKSRPSSMYDMEQGRINIGDNGWLASPYNPPRQGYKPNSFTLADTKPSTHAEAYGSYFKRVFMKNDGFANAVLQLEPSKLYRTKYSTTEAQFTDSFLQNVPRESIDDARAWVADKVYGIENGKPSFKVSNKDDDKPKAKTQEEVKKEIKTETEKETKTESSENTVDESTYVDTSEELTTLKLDKDTLASIKEQFTGKSTKVESSNTETREDIESTDTKEGISTTKTESNETNTDSETDIDSETDEPNLTGFKRESATVNTVFKITPEQVEQEKQKHWQSQNHLILGFKQEGDNPLVSILDLASNLENDYETGIKELLPKLDVTEAQLNQLKVFLDFNKRLSKSLKKSYFKEPTANDGRDYSYRDFKGYLQKEDGSFDENILTALSLAAYSHFIVNNKDTNTFKDVGRLLGYPEEVNVPQEVLHKYLYLGDKYNNAVNSIGRTVYDLLGLKTNKDVSELYRGRMIASLGNWVTSTLVTQGLMYEYTMPNSEFKKDSFGTDGAENSDEPVDDGSTVTFISFTKPNGEGKVKYIDDIVEASKGTNGFLGKLFGGDVGLRSPTLEPTENVKRDIRGTTAKVSDTQANLQKHMQQEPIVINKDSFNSLHKLVEQFPTQAKTMIGAYISEDTLNNIHESKRESAKARVEGSNKELEKLVGFTSGLNKDDEGNYQEFFDSNYVTKNNRGQYNSNEVNMQTMKIHRAMSEYKNFEQVIEADVLNSITGNETDFVKDGQLTDLGHLFSAIAENAEGTEDVIKYELSHLSYRRGFTVDKVRAEDFLPTFFEHLETDEAIQNGVTSTQKLLEGKELKQTDMDNIQSVVDSWGMQALSFRALIEYAKFKQAQKDNNDLITSFGLGADGINNGSAISYTLMGLMVNKDNPDLMNQIGVFTEESGFSNFHETRLKGLNDYYEGLGTIMEQELSNYRPEDRLEVNLLYRLNPSIQGRKGAKEILVPAGYGAGTKRLLEVAFKSMIGDITTAYESLHLRVKELEANKASMTEAEYNKTLQGIQYDYNKLQDDLRAALDDEEFNLPHPKDMLSNKAFLTKNQQSTLKQVYDDVIGKLIIESFNRYTEKLNVARRANISFHESSANIYLILHKAQLDTALEAKKEKIKESLNTNHKELVQDRLVNSNARRAKNKEPLTYEDMLEIMTNDQLEFEGLTKQEYKDKVEKPLLKVFPTLNTAFNYDEPKHKRKFSDIRILKSKTTTVDVADSYQMKTKGIDGKVKYKKASILTHKWVSAGVASNSAQVQSVDARAAFEAAAMNGNVSLNVHDNVISGRRNYVSMVRVLNKKFYETTRDYHANLASVNAFVDTLSGLVSIKDELNEEAFNNTLIDSLVDFLDYTSKEIKEYLFEADGDFKTIMSDVTPQVINKVAIAIQRDIQKLRHYERVTIVHQYAGYGGEYTLTAVDKAKEKQEIKKLEYVQREVKERLTKLLAKISKTNADALSTKVDSTRRQEPKDLETETLNESKVEKEYTLNAVKRFIDKLREDSPEFSLFDYLESVFDKNKDIKVVFTDKLPNESVEGMYDNKTNKIYFRESLFKDTTISKDKKIRLINHELLHALTETGLRLGKANNSKAYQDLTKMYEQIKAKANGKFSKELSDINEFITYGLTDEKFRKFIANNLDAKDISRKGRFRGTLNKFLRAVHSILGFSTSNNFDKFTKTVHSLIVPYEAITETNKAEQRYSQSNVTSDMSTVEVIQSLDDSMIGTEHNQRLNGLTERIIGTFGMNSKQDNLVDNNKILQSDALTHGFKMSDKEIAVYNSLHAVFTAIENHSENQNYQSLVKLYSDAKKQLSYKDFLTTNRPTSEDVSEAKSKYDYVFNSAEHLDDRIAVFASLGLANEEMVKVLQKPRKTKQREVESLFDKLMSIFDLVFKTLTELAFFEGGKDFQSQLDVLSSKLLRVDADVRANKQALHDIAWQGVGIITKPLNKAVHLAMNKASKQLSKLEDSENVHLSNLGAIFGSFEEMKEDGKQVEMANIISKINENSAKGRYNEVRNLINEGVGIVGDTSKTVMEKLLRLTQNIGRLREKHRKAVMRDIKSYFPKKGKNLTPEETSAVTRALLRTDVSSLLNDGNQAEVYKLITDNEYRQEAIEELHSLISSFKLSKSKTNGIIMSAMDLAAYLAKEEVPNNLYKNAEGIARFYGQEGNTKLTEAIDKLATLQALEYVDKSDLDTVKNMMKSYPDAMWNVLYLHKAYTTISKEQEFKYNKYSYQKGYLPQDTNNLRSLVVVKKTKIKNGDTTNAKIENGDITAAGMDEIIKLQNEGWELLTQSPDGMKQDSADLTTPRYLMFHKNSNYRNYNSGALDMKDTHAKGSIIYTYKNHKDITRYIKDKDNLMAKRNTTVIPKDYNPFADTGNMVMAYDPNGAIINVHYEMRGATRDKYLERNNNFIDLMGLYVSGIDAKPMLMEQQADVAKVLHQDYKLNYKLKPNEFIVLDPRSKDEKTQETLRMMPYSFRVEAERLFGKNQPIIVKKSVFLMTFGYRQLSLGDLFDKHFDDLGAFSKTFVIASKAVLGEKAKGRIMMAEYFVSRLTSLVADIIVIRNPAVLKGNIISNSLMLMLRGVNPVNVIKESIRVWKQGRDYIELENELNDLRVKYQTAKDKTQIEKEMRDIYARMGKHPLSVYFKQGLMASIVEDVKIEDRDTYGSLWEEMLDETTDKYVPEKVKDGVDFFMMNRGSPLHNTMTHATQFSDFSAKIILIEHLKKQGMSEKQAIAEAQDIFINFDIPTGAKMDYANRMGLMMFTKFYIRFQKAMVRSIGRTPASTLLQHTLVEQFTNEAGMLDPFVLNRLGNNPFDLAPLSLPSASDDILTMKIVDAMIPDIF